MNRGGMGIGGVLLIVFIVLKLIGQIDWSWWWVLSPLWISVFLFLVFLIVLYIVDGIDRILKGRQRGW